MDAEEKKLVVDIVDALKRANQKAYDAYLYAREIDLTLQKVPRLADEFRKEFAKLHGNEKIPEIGAIKDASKDSQNSIDKLAKSLR